MSANSTDLHKIMTKENEELFSRYSSLRRYAPAQLKHIYDRIVDLFETSYKNNQTLLTEDYIRYYFTFPKELDEPLKNLTKYGILRHLSLCECYIKNDPSIIEKGSVNVELSKKIFYTMFLSKDETKKMFYNSFQKSLLDVIQQSARLLIYPEAYPIILDALRSLDVSKNLVELSLKILFNNNSLSILNIPILINEGRNASIQYKQIYYLPSSGIKILSWLSDRFSEIYTQQLSFFNDCLNPELQYGLFVPVKNNKDKFIFNAHDIALLSTIILKYSSAFPLRHRVIASRALVIVGSIQEADAQNIDQYKTKRQDNHYNTKMQTLLSRFVNHLKRTEGVIPETTFFEKGLQEGLDKNKIIKIIKSFPNDILSFKVRNNGKSLTYYVAIKHLIKLYNKHVKNKTPIAPLILGAWQNIFYKYSLNQVGLAEILSKLECTDAIFWSIFNQFDLK